MVSTTDFYAPSYMYFLLCRLTLVMFVNGKLTTGVPELNCI